MSKVVLNNAGMLELLVMCYLLRTHLFCCHKDQMYKSATQEKMISIVVAGSIKYFDK